MLQRLGQSFILASFALFSSVSAHAGLTTCDSYRSPMLGKTVKYCFQRSRPDLPQQNGEAVVYFMHGLDGDEQTYEENGYAEAVATLGKTENLKSFTTVSFETNGLSFFSDVGSFHSGKDSYETWFISEFMPKIEKEKRLCQKKECRAIIGHSMGGFGALKTGLRHSDLFSVIAANSPALVPYNFREKDAVFSAYFDRHPIGAARGMPLLKIAQNIFSNWDYANYNDPNYLAEKYEDRNSFPRLYFDVGGRDEFGFQEGFWRLSDILNRKNFPYVAFFNPNGTHELFRERRWDLIRFVGGNLRN